MLKRNRLLLISSSVVLLCLSLIVGATFALFTEESSVTHHLKAGELKASLVRHTYAYTVLGDDGVMKTVTPSGDEEKNIDFSDANSSNFFGFDNSKTYKMVPGCSFSAEFTIANKGTTAFTYNFDFVGVDGKTISNAFAKQLNAEIFAVSKDGKTKTAVASGTVYEFLNDGAKVYSANNGEHLVVGANSSTKFVVTVTFTPASNNNDAENGNVWFDFVVNATQYTGK